MFLKDAGTVISYCDAVNLVIESVQCVAARS